jgi:hypothetical protein
MQRSTTTQAHVYCGGQKKRTSTVRSYKEAASKSNVAFATVMTPVEGLMLKRRSLSPLVMRYVNTWPWQGQARTPTNEGNKNLERNTNREAGSVEYWKIRAAQPKT